MSYFLTILAMLYIGYIEFTYLRLVERKSYLGFAWKQVLSRLRVKTVLSRRRVEKTAANSLARSFLKLNLLIPLINF